MELELFLKLLLAAVLGGVLGMERQVIHTGSGLRTVILVTVGAALLTFLTSRGPLMTSAGVNGAEAPGAGVAGAIVLAVGVMGAGAAIKERFARQGLITAAAIWSAGAIGIAVGMGFYLIALISALLIVGVMALLTTISRLLENQRGYYPYLIVTDDRPAVLILIKKILTELGVAHQPLHIRKAEKGLEVEITLITSANKNQSFLEKLMQTPGIREVINESL